MHVSRKDTNDEEADRVRRIFELYLDSGSLVAVSRELDRRGWRGKQWTTRKHANRRGGKPFTKTSLYYLLTNPVYVGKVKHKDEVHDGEHEAIVERNVFQRVQERLAANGQNGGREVRNRCGALLRGLVRCKACGCAMSHSFSTRGNRRYRYYVCTNAQKRGWKACPHPSLPAGELEQFVVEQIRDIGRDPQVVAETLAAVRRAAETRVERLARERGATRRKLGDLEAEIAKLATANLPEDVRYQHVAATQDELLAVRRRLAEVEDELASLADPSDDSQITASLAAFDGVWESLQPREQARVIALLVESVEYDAASGSISIEFSATGATALARKETAA